MKKVILWFVVILLILWFVTFLIDFYCVSCNLPPIFVKIMIKYQDGGSYQAYGLGYKVIAYRSLFNGYCFYQIGLWNLKYNGDLSNAIHKTYDITHPVSNIL